MKDLSRKVIDAFEPIKYLSINTVTTFYPKTKVNQPLDGFGALSTKENNSVISGTIWSSNVFPYKCDDQHHFLLSMVKEDLSKNELLDSVSKRLRTVYQIDCNPTHSYVQKWDKELPVYNKELKNLQNQIRPLQHEGIFFHANWIDGISIKECISKSKKISTFL